MQPIARCFVLVFCVLLATRTASAAVTGNIGVTVVNADNQPVPNVDVALGDDKRFSAKTDGKGRAIFSDVPVNTYDLTIGLNGEPKVVLIVSVEQDRTQLYTVPLEVPPQKP